MHTEATADCEIAAPLVRTAGLNKRHAQRAPFSPKGYVIDALKDVTLEVAPARITALIGESGSGKSTLGRCLALLEKADSGDIWFEGREVSRLSKRELRALRPSIQMIFQDSGGALNPRLTAAQIVAEPLEILKQESSTGLRSRACELMEEVGLSASWAGRRPLEFSGGQRQRLAIARAVAVKPRFMILDESLSGLDLSTQAHILNLLMDLQEMYAFTYLVISHDIGLLGQIADFVAVMRQGRIVEQGTRQEIFGNPQGTYTQELLRSVRLVESGSSAARAGERS
jgi:ABC-type glutathione transport system ATPase component